MKHGAELMSAGTSNKVADRGSNDAESKDVSLQVMVPAHIKREVSLKAAQEGTTQRTIILSALKAVGFMVKDEELCDKRKMR
ncbi:hypothetical protein AvCA_36090 [Azotobacter vinelandii CA]|uniref:Uncharacterized protein n=2 Tax=Azotobacter vinelandii TaxID=354 RepID=C1DR98_AZOVD|nr:hypothetical protein [Azotobacter vinelandii]ACO79756.1 conserved hypothetical protein [Azotobacter vinelandii DJ]AGK16234.1 hypothetical protein AvCA_36090 [Azotobacter vinelandii CA]AGK21474.1 hypothetical protein AvCA6_36090 [Azotobacter vinelandii CA6]GLK59187.1 hypothetical protein GCM10017624_13440 [Azotobacter vinelandii]